MRSTLRILAITIALLAPASTVTAQQIRTGERFRDPASITGDPTGLLPDPTVRPAPRYPDEARAAHRTAAPVVVFVVDTLGHVELSTASFLDDSAEDFRQAVCALLPQLRFQPLELGGRKWRVLLVQFYGFNTWQAPDSAGLARAESLMRERQEFYATRPLTEVIPELERRPHCDSPGEG